ncbi:hypothetical protein ACLKA6_018051 [Drosophila palustris]
MSSSESREETAAISSSTESQFKPIVFTNEPDDDEDRKLSMGRQNLKKWLGRMVRVTLRNKLVLVGIFSCTDHDQNLVIANCDQFMPDDEQPISYGNVMVPGNQILTFEVDMPKEEDVELIQQTDPETKLATDL